MNADALMEFFYEVIMSKKLVRPLLIAVAIAALCVIIWCGWYLYQYMHGNILGNELLESWRGEQTADNIMAESVEIPVDFDELRDINPEIYAWLYVPGMDISYPVVQHDGDNNYYIRRSVDGQYYTGGCIYSENYNHKDFSDRMTVLYGHNLRSGKMFAPLNDFADVKVYDEHRYIYIYLPDRMLVYEIFAATPHPSEHLLLNHDFNNRQEYNDFFGEFMYKRNLNANYLENVELNYSDDKILTLSTCLRGDNQQRFLVMGRLISDIPGK